MALYRVVINQSLYGQLVQNRIYVQSEAFQEPAEVAAHIKNTWVNTVKFLQHNLLQYFSIVVTGLEAGVGQHTELLSQTFGGQAGEGQTTSFHCGVMQFKTGLVGRKFRGRYYIAATRMGGTQLGQFTASEFGLWGQQIAILKDAFTGANGGSTGLALMIRGENVVHNTLVTDIGLRPTLGIQRRRNIGVGA